MFSCCPSFFKVPHLTNRCYRERIIQFFLRTFIFVNVIISTVILLASATVRVKLGLPRSCCGLTENIYMSTYTLFAMTVFSYICMFLTCIKSSQVKSSGHLTGHVVIFLVIVVSELFITILSIIQSKRIPAVLSDNANIFASGKCLMEVESRFRCCGFRNFTEWPAHLTTSGDDKQVIFQYEQLNAANMTLLDNATQLSPNDVFSKSCQCMASKPTKCVTLNYILSFQNVTSDTSSDHLGKNITVKPNFASMSTAVSSVTIHSNTCFSKIRGQLKDMYMAIGLISILGFVAQLIVFAFHFYLIHNMEGTAAVSDIYRPSTETYGNYSHSRSSKITFLDLSIVGAESQNDHRSGLTTTYEGSVSTDNAVMTEVSSKELTDVDGTIILHDVSPNLDGSVRLGSVAVVQCSKSINITF